MSGTRTRIAGPTTTGCDERKATEVRVSHGRAKSAGTSDVGRLSLADIRAQVRGLAPDAVDPLRKSADARTLAIGNKLRRDRGKCSGRGSLRASTDWRRNSGTEAKGLNGLGSSTHDERLL